MQLVSLVAHSRETQAFIQGFEIGEVADSCGGFGVLFGVA